MIAPCIASKYRVFTSGCTTAILAMVMITSRIFSFCKHTSNMDSERRTYDRRADGSVQQAYCAPASSHATVKPSIVTPHRTSAKDWSVPRSGRILERFTRDLNLWQTFETRMLPNSKKLQISMERDLLHRHFMKLLD